MEQVKTTKFRRGVCYAGLCDVFGGIPEVDREVLEADLIDIVNT